MYKTASRKATNSSNDRTDLFTRVTDEIVRALEEGAGEYSMPWNTGQGSLLPSNATTGKHYRGVNILSLWGRALLKGYSSSKWATYKQWHFHGCPVMKGEKGTMVVFWDTYFDPELDQDERTEKVVAKGYWVFNSDQVEGYEPEVPEVQDAKERIVNAEYFFGCIGSEVQHGGEMAAYSPTRDMIRMPEFEAFKDAQGYYSVLAHEHIHWTGHPERLDRDISGKFGDESYAMEELIAELGAAFVCGHLNVRTDPRLHHAPYLATWLRVLRNDNRAVFKAASFAQKACDYLITESEAGEVSG